MKKAAWKRKIRQACVDAGTYREYFDQPIAELAQILEMRDDAIAQYKESGSLPTIEYTNKAGATNIIKNPALQIIDELNKSALAYWRDLGLTPAGLKRIDENAMKPKKKSALADAFRGLS